MAVLIGMSGKVQGQSFEIDKDVVTVGRNKDNDIMLDIPSVSGRHCSIATENNKYTLRDLDSTNGTLLNAVKIKIAQLKPKDIVLIGSVEFMFDGENVAVDEDNVMAATQVIVGQGAPSAPKSFTSISPFGTREKSSRGIWARVIVGVLILALLATLVLIIRLLFS
ncbi:MAG: FHA domain-containing protein [Kiritimatiellae bacterium]|nr:FHA domain-containing protein [Kiritimatiellia bacterium]